MNFEERELAAILEKPSEFFAGHSNATTAATYSTTPAPTIEELLEIKRKFDAIPRPAFDVLMMSEYEWPQVKKQFPAPEIVPELNTFPGICGIRVYTFLGYDDYKDTLDSLLKRGLRVGVFVLGEVRVIRSDGAA